MKKSLYYETFCSPASLTQFVQVNKIKDIVAITRKEDRNRDFIELWFRTKKPYTRITTKLNF